MSRKRDMLTMVGLAAYAVGGLLWCGCLTPPMEPPVERDWYLLEDFENERLWTLDSANNYGRVDYTDRLATHGKYAVVLDFFDNGRFNSMFRKEVNYDLSTVSELALDAFNHNARGGVRIALAFRTKKGGFYETVPRDLAAGWNRGVRFDLVQTGMKEGTVLTRWMAEREHVTRMMLLVFPGENAQGRVTVDHLLADQPGVDRAPSPILVGSTRVPETVTRFKPVEVTLTFRVSTLLKRPLSLYDKPGELVPVHAAARLTRPDGERVVVRGFLKEREARLDGSVTFAVRLNPDATGPWHLYLGYWADRRWVPVVDQDFVCEEGEAPAGGMVRVDPDDPTMLSLSTGEPFYPIGQNVCWAADYEPYLQRVAEYGGNSVRIWVCPWNNPLLEGQSLSAINAESARAIDTIFERAQELGIYVQPVLAYHGWLTDDWHRNPFNEANQGPCALPQDFWVDGQARAAFKRYLNYAVKRWACYPNLLAWELVNEADLTPRYDDKHIVDWHQEMGAYLKRSDPYRHLVTTSVVHNEAVEDLWWLPEIDVTSSHLYDPDLTAALNRRRVRHARYHKPYFVAEIGRGWLASADQRDPEGRYLHHALWLGWMTPAAGNCWPWWWDTHIEPNQLYGHFAALAAFDRGEDRRGKHYATWMTTVTRADKTTLLLQGIANHHEVFGFVYDPAVFKQPQSERPAALLRSSRSITIDGLLDGPYRVEIWDTYTGRAGAGRTVPCRDGQLAIPLPAAGRDFAFKAKAVRDPGVRVRVGTARRP